MPVQSCQENGKPGYKCGPQGKCYTYSSDSGKGSAWRKACAQCRAQGKPCERGTSMGIKIVVDGKQQIDEITEI